MADSHGWSKGYEKINKTECLVKYGKTGYADYLPDNHHTIYNKSSSPGELVELADQYNSN